MKATGICNAILLFIGGLMAWSLLIWLPHRGLGILSVGLGSYENLPPLTKKIYLIEEAFISSRYLILCLYSVLCVGYYFFYCWAAKGPSGRMTLHNVIMIAFIIMVYGFLIYSVVGLRTVVSGLQG